MDAQNLIIRKCMQHLDILGADEKTKQIVSMYMECLSPMKQEATEKPPLLKMEWK